MCLVCVCDVCGLHVFCVWGLVCVLLECVCGMWCVCVCVCVCVSCMCGVCVVHTGHAVECGMAVGYTPRSGHPSLRSGSRWELGLFPSPPASPCLVGGSGVGCPDPPWGSHGPKVLMRDQGSCDHWADKTSHADLAHVLGKSAFEKALGWSGNLNFRGSFPAFPGLIGSPTLLV